MYEVKLSHAPNPDIADGYWQDGNPFALNVTAKVPNLLSASVVCRNYITRNGLGGGNWTGGQVFENGKQIARVSYNGRVWGMDGNEITI